VVTRINVNNARHVLVPVRFTRAELSMAEFDKPELDDRGYHMGTRPSGWGTTDARGPMLGLMQDATEASKLKVVREALDDTAELYVTSTNPAIVEITSPAGGGPLAADGLFECKGLGGEGDAPKIQCRLGSAEGPVLAEVEPHVLPRLRIAITPHEVRLDGAAGNGTRASLTNLAAILLRVRKVWRPCGVDFTINATVQDNITLPSNLTDRLDDAGGWTADHNALLRLQRTRLGLAAGTNDQSVNVYIIPRYKEPSTFVGYGISRETATASGMTDTGISVITNGVNGNAVEEERTARTIAHEIGHFLRLKHVEEKNASDPVQYTYGRRQLMFPISRVPAGRVNDFGNGAGFRGHLITMKNLAHHSTDGEADRARRTIRSGNWT
jgi:hypothetical protein